MRTTYGYIIDNQLRLKKAEQLKKAEEHTIRSRKAVPIKQENHYQYNQLGQLTEASGGGVIYNYTYSPNGNMMDKLVNGENALSYHYTSSGRVAGIQDKTGKKATYQYNRAGKVESVKDNGKLVAEYSYYEDGSLQKVCFANGVETEYTYDADKNYRSIITKTAEGETLLEYTYQYDGNGNRTQKAGAEHVTKHNGNDSSVGTTSYLYDSLQRLQEVSYPTGRLEQYQYDQAGNRALKKYGTAENFKTGSYLEEYYSYDNQNRLVERNNPQNVTYYQYDKQGNTVSELTKRYLKQGSIKTQEGSTTTVTTSMAQTEVEQYKTYEYDSFNKTAQTVVEKYKEGGKETHIQRNYYDAENLRYGIEEDGERTNLVTNGWSVFTELDAEWKPTKRLVRGYGIVASEEIDRSVERELKPFAEIQNQKLAEKYHFYHQNEHGDSEYITGRDGKVKNAYTYDAFGNITNIEELVKNRYTYNGEQYDQISQQYYLRARNYNPLIGRFTQEDVYRGDGLNLYAYCGNNPVMYVDPSGYVEKVIKSNIKEVNDILQKNANGSQIPGTVPGNSNGFDSWYNGLSDSDVATLYQDGQVADKIKDRLRGDGGVHEWFMVAEAPKTKSWGVTAEDVKSATSNIESIRFVNIETKKFGVRSGAHGNKNGTIEASVSSTAHLQIQKMIQDSDNAEDFIKKLRTWSDEHLEITTIDGEVIKGSDGLPEFLKKDSDIPEHLKKCKL